MRKIVLLSHYPIIPSPHYLITPSPHHPITPSPRHPVMSNQLSILIPAKTFSLSIGEVTLKPFKFKQFKTALEIVEKYITIFTVYSTAQDIAMAMFEKVESDYSILSDICRLIELVANLLDEQVAELTYDEVLGLLTEIIEMNMDFFNRMGEKLNPPKEGEQLDQQKTGELKSVA